MEKSNGEKKVPEKRASEKKKVTIKRKFIWTIF